LKSTFPDLLRDKQNEYKVTYNSLSMESTSIILRRKKEGIFFRCFEIAGDCNTSRSLLFSFSSSVVQNIYFHLPNPYIEKPALYYCSTEYSFMYDLDHTVAINR